MSLPPFFAFRASLLIVAAVSLTMALTGCEEDLAATRGLDEPFALYGVLSPDLDTQAVRVYPVEPFPTRGSANGLDVEVTSVDLQSGERRLWEDSVIVDSIGRHEYVYLSPFRVEFDRTYRVEAVRSSDGAASFADVRIPPPASVRIDESRAPLLDVFVEGDEIRILRPEAIYDVDKGPPLLRFEISYEGRERVVENGWQVTFNMIVDAEEVNYLYNAFAPELGGKCRVDYVVLKGLELHATVGDTAWNPNGGYFDPNILSQPSRLSNVENGFGFVGGGYSLNAPLNPSSEAVESACFRYGL